MKKSKGWEIKSRKLVKEFEFPNFNSGLKFVNKIGEIAEEENHHPDIELSYGRVKIKLITHEEEKVTCKDIKMAERINQIK
jgi:4a-hydroxytetrahydrobiopterin dehydratase